MTLGYLWSRFFKRLPGSAIRNSVFEAPSRAEADSTVIDTSMGRYSYCGYHCTLIRCRIGRFCSIADNVSIGLATHPMEWVSTSPAFYRGRDSIPKDLASLDYDPAPAETVIGNDVWIGAGVHIRPGVTVGNGAVIGMGSVVTRDVAPYTIVAGNPARVIRTRFPEELCRRLNASCWWDRDPAFLKDHSHLMDRPEEFLRVLEENT